MEKGTAVTVEYKFRAADAFVYVDTYRRHILYPAPRVQADLNRVRERLLDPNQNLSPTRLYAELRAVEHALAFVIKREEPGLVLLGEGEGEGDMPVAAANGPGKSAKQLAHDLRLCEEHAETLELSLKQSKQREHELAAELQSREQYIERLKLRLETNQSTITVLSATLAVMVLVLVLVLFL
jgi:chromosome segregation ATPase